MEFGSALGGSSAGTLGELGLLDRKDDEAGVTDPLSLAIGAGNLEQRGRSALGITMQGLSTQPAAFGVSGLDDTVHGLGGIGGIDFDSGWLSEHLTGEATTAFATKPKLPSPVHSAVASPGLTGLTSLGHGIYDDSSEADVYGALDAFGLAAETEAHQATRTSPSSSDSEASASESPDLLLPKSRSGSDNMESQAILGRDTESDAKRNSTAVAAREPATNPKGPMPSNIVRSSPASRAQAPGGTSSVKPQPAPSNDISTKKQAGAIPASGLPQKRAARRRTSSKRAQTPASANLQPRLGATDGDAVGVMVSNASKTALRVGRQAAGAIWLLGGSVWTETASRASRATLSLRRRLRCRVSVLVLLREIVALASLTVVSLTVALWQAVLSLAHAYALVSTDVAAQWGVVEPLVLSAALLLLLPSLAPLTASTITSLASLVRLCPSLPSTAPGFALGVPASDGSSAAVWAAALLAEQDLIPEDVGSASDALSSARDAAACSGRVSEGVLALLTTPRLQGVVVAVMCAVVTALNAGPDAADTDDGASRSSTLNTDNPGDVGSTGGETDAEDIDGRQSCTKQFSRSAYRVSMSVLLACWPGVVSVLVGSVALAPLVSGDVGVAETCLMLLGSAACAAQLAAACDVRARRAGVPTRTRPPGGLARRARGAIARVIVASVRARSRSSSAGGWGNIHVPRSIEAAAVATLAAEAAAAATSRAAAARAASRRRRRRSIITTSSTTPNISNTTNKQPSTTPTLTSSEGKGDDQHSSIDGLSDSFGDSDEAETLSSMRPGALCLPRVLVAPVLVLGHWMVLCQVLRFADGLVMYHEREIWLDDIAI